MLTDKREDVGYKCWDFMQWPTAGRAAKDARRIKLPNRMSLRGVQGVLHKSNPSGWLEA